MYLRVALELKSGMVPAKEYQVWSVEVSFCVPDNWLSSSRRISRAALELKSGMGPASRCHLWSVDVSFCVPVSWFPNSTSSWSAALFSNEGIGPKKRQMPVSSMISGGQFWRTWQLIVVKLKRFKSSVGAEIRDGTCKRISDMISGRQFWLTDQAAVVEFNLRDVARQTIHFWQSETSVAR